MTDRPTVVLDFDGTLALGPGPLHAYIDALAAQVDGERLAEDCRDAVARFDEGSSAARDGYDAVRSAALEHGVTDAQLGSAYLTSRTLLGTEAAPVVAPDGLPAFLATLAGIATCVLATNAPDVGIDRALDALGITGAISARHHDVGKPAGLTPIISDLLAHGPVLAVGDIWEYDLAPAAALGADTALVGVRRPADAQPTLRGATLAELREPILAWARAARASAA